MGAVREGDGDVVVVPEVDVSRLPESIGQEVTRILGAAQVAAAEIRVSAEREAAVLQRRVARLRTGLASVLEQLRQLEEDEAEPGEPSVGEGTAGAGVPAVAAVQPVVGEEPWPVPAAAPPPVEADDAAADDDDPEAAEIQARVSNQISVVERLRRMAT